MLNVMCASRRKNEFRPTKRCCSRRPVMPALFQHSLEKPTPLSPHVLMYLRRQITAPFSPHIIGDNLAVRCCVGTTGGTGSLTVTSRKQVGPRARAIIMRYLYPNTYLRRISKILKQPAAAAAGACRPHAYHLMMTIHLPSPLK